MIKLYSLMAFIFLISTSQTTFADDVNDRALKDTQALLRNQQKRGEVLKGDQRAKDADAYAGEAVGGDAKLKNGVYDASADIMGTLHKQSGGDAAKMNEILQQAMRNPEGFLKSLPADQQAKIKQLATQAEANRKPAASQPKP